MKITQYTTATADNFKSLDAAITELLAQGFQPYGSPYSSRDTKRGLAGVVTVAQAMVKCEADTEIQAKAI